MGGSARVGQFGQPDPIYGSFVPVVKPTNNVVVPTAAQQVADAAAAQNQLLIDQLRALENNQSVPTSPTLPAPQPAQPYDQTPAPTTPPSPTVYGSEADALARLQEYLAGTVH